MPTFVTPWLFGVAVAASLVVAGLHLLSVRTPPPLVFPTARFVPDGEARAVARQPRLSDVPLLLLRVLALWCAGAALAGIQWPLTRASRLRLVVADAAWQADRGWRDSVTRALGGDDALVAVAFSHGVTEDAGAALVTATRRTAELVARHRSLEQVELTVVLPAATRSAAGYAAWRSQWPGAVRVVVREPGRPAASARRAVQVTGAGRDDLVAAAYADGGSGSDGPMAGRTVVRISRGPGERSGGAQARDSNGWTGADGIEGVSVTVHWPVDGVPNGWESRPNVDTVGAVVANGVVLAGPFVRMARLSPAARARLDSGTAAARPLQAIAWWSDGEPAALEEAVGVDSAGRPSAEGASAVGASAVTGVGCRRTVAVVPSRGSDGVLSAAGEGLLQAVAAPCGAQLVATAAVGEVGRDAGADLATRPLAAADAFREPAAGGGGSDPWWLTPLLLGLAVLALLGEWWWRRREAGA